MEGFKELKQQKCQARILLDLSIEAATSPDLLLDPDGAVSAELFMVDLNPVGLVRGALLELAE